MKNNLDKLLQKGLLWSMLEVFIKRLFDLLVKLVLARILFPEEFGIVGMAAVFTSFVQVISEMGIGSALIQRKKEQLNDLHFQTAFWFSLLWGTFLYGIIIFLSPLVSEFYNEPVLQKVVPILGLPILVSSVNTINKAQLMRELNFKKLAIINNVSSILAGIGAIVLAFNDFGIWALVFNVVVPFFVAVPLLFMATQWKPKLVWEKKAFFEIFGFGIFTFGTAIILNISANVDYLVIGKLISAASLGAYTLAFMLTSMVSSQITSMVNRVMFPFYSAIQSDLEKVKIYYLRVVKYYAVIIYPIMLSLIVLGGPILSIFFGAKWVEAKVPMRILAVAVLINVLTSSYNLLFRSIGKPRLEMKILLSILIFATIPAIVFGANFYGIRGVAYGILFSSVVNLLVVLVLLKKHFQINWRNISYAVTPAVIAFIITFAIISSLYLYTSMHAILIIALLFVIYFTICAFFFKEELQKLKSILKR
tara:strand:+ start:67790 stop:69223 length:1434 start_codon:yes stop_codon:yes gene_type:complete